MKADPKSFWKFTESVNFWVAAVNILLGIVLLTFGIQVAAEAVNNVISFIFSQDYWEAGTVFIINILMPIFKILIKPKDQK